MVEHQTGTTAKGEVRLVGLLGLWFMLPASWPLQSGASRTCHRAPPAVHTVGAPPPGPPQTLACTRFHRPRVTPDSGPALPSTTHDNTSRRHFGASTAEKPLPSRLPADPAPASQASPKSTRWRACPVCTHQGPWLGFLGLLAPPGPALASPHLCGPPLSTVDTKGHHFPCQRAGPMW